MGKGIFLSVSNTKSTFLIVYKKKKKTLHFKKTP